MKLSVVLRTCDKKSIQGDRVVPKDECVSVCSKSLMASLRGSGLPFALHVIDDNSSDETREKLKRILPEAKSLPDEDLVYLVEDDYLHYPDSVLNIVSSWEYFSLLFPRNEIGIFPQDFNQMYYHPQNMFNGTYVEGCMVVPGPERYFRTTWFTHESFLVKAGLIKKYSDEFDGLLDIGTKEGCWEGNTISNVWQKPEVMMLMPLGTLAIHLGCHKDISFYVDDWKELYEEYNDARTQET